MNRLQQALAEIDALDASRPPRALQAGRSNSAWRIAAGGRELVLRLAPAERPQTADFAREIEIHRHAHAAGLAPALWHVDESLGLVVTEYLPGGTLRRGAGSSPRTIERVGELLREVHALPRCGTRIDMPAAAARYRERVPEPHRAAADTMYRTVARYCERLDERELVLCHNDPVAENVIDGERLRLIDWEFAADGDAMFDLAAVCVDHGYDEAQSRRLLESYGLPASADALQRLDRQRRVYRAIDWLWLHAWGA